MSTFIVAGILIGIIIAICLLIYFIDKKEKRKHMKQFLKEFSELGSNYKLSFSSQTIQRESVIGLDGIHRKVLILNIIKSPVEHHLIDLDEVKSCTVKKTYGSINKGGLKDRKLEQYLEKVSLCFEFKTSKGAIAVSFYSSLEDYVHQAPELEQKAKDWEVILSKMLHDTKQLTGAL